MSEIFICYRREDSSADAGRIYDRLTMHFGHDRIFMDIDHIEPGEDFTEVIQKKLNTVKVAIILIGKRWLDITDSSGHRRLDNPDDFVYLEITSILERKIRAIPVLVGGAVIPKSSQLPDQLIPLVRRQAFEVSNIRFHSDVDILIEKLEKVIASQSPPKLPEYPNKRVLNNVIFFCIMLVLLLGYFFSNIKEPINLDQATLESTETIKSDQKTSNTASSEFTKTPKIENIDIPKNIITPRIDDLGWNKSVKQLENFGENKTTNSPDESLTDATFGSTKLSSEKLDRVPTPKAKPMELIVNQTNLLSNPDSKTNNNQVNQTKSSQTKIYEEKSNKSTHRKSENNRKSDIFFWRIMAGKANLDDRVKYMNEYLNLNPNGEFAAPARKYLKEIEWGLKIANHSNRCLTMLQSLTKAPKYSTIAQELILHYKTPVTFLKGWEEIYKFPADIIDEFGISGQPAIIPDDYRFYKSLMAYKNYSFGNQYIRLMELGYGDVAVTNLSDCLNTYWDKMGRLFNLSMYK